MWSLLCNSSGDKVLVETLRRDLTNCWDRDINSWLHTEVKGRYWRTFHYLASKCQSCQHNRFLVQRSTDGPTGLCKNGKAENQLSNMDSSSTECALLMEGEKHSLMLCGTVTFTRFRESKPKQNSSTSPRKDILLKIKQTVQCSLLCIFSAPVCGLRILFTKFLTF